MKYTFQRIDVHFVTIEADSLAEAQEEVTGMSVLDDRVEVEAGDWAPLNEDE
jgi:hypothetical protein